MVANLGESKIVHGFCAVCGSVPQPTVVQGSTVLNHMASSMFKGEIKLIYKETFKIYI